MKGNLNVPEFCGGCTTIATNLFFTADSIIWIEEVIADVLVAIHRSYIDLTESCSKMLKIIF